MTNAMMKRIETVSGAAIELANFQGRNARETQMVNALGRAVKQCLTHCVRGEFAEYFEQLEIAEAYNSELVEIYNRDFSSMFLLMADARRMVGEELAKAA